MPADSTMRCLGPAFFLALLWLAGVVAAAATADLWAVPAYDEMDWDQLYSKDEIEKWFTDNHNEPVMVFPPVWSREWADDEVITAIK